MQSGGNAIDAGVAAGLCLNVLLPYLTNLGGVAPIIIYSAKERKVTTVSGLGRWPRAASIEAMKERGDGAIPVGILRCVTPAALDAWVMAIERYGRLTFAEVAAPALELAEGGFVVDRQFRAALASNETRLKGWPSTKAVFFPNGSLPVVGAPFRQPDLGRTLRTLVAAEAKGRTREARLRSVRDAFYKGPLAKAMAAFSAAEGG